MTGRARRPYPDAIAWMRARVPGRRDRAALASRAFGACLGASVFLMCAIGMLSPARFGSQGSRSFGSGWPDLVLVAVALGCAAWAVKRRRGALRVVERVREPFRGPLEDDPGYAGASGSLAACRGPLRTRFALGWIWAPAGAAVLAAAASLGGAYFLVDAVLARFEIGWQQPVFAAFYLTVSWLVFRVAAGRLAVWPLALSAHRAATVGY